MQKSKFIALILISVVCASLLPCPTQLDVKTWKLLILFCSSIVGIILEFAASYFVLLVFLLIAGLFGVIELDKSFTGFGSNTVWFLLIMLTLSNVIKNTNIIPKITNIVVRLFGKNIVSLSYGLCFIEWLFSIVTPSNVARAGSIGAPLVSSMSKSIAQQHKHVSEQRIGSYLSLLYRYSNSVCSAAFLTGATANKLISDAAKNAGYRVSMFEWMCYMFIPCLIILLFLPIIINIVSDHGIDKKDRLYDTSNDVVNVFSRKEKLLMLIFIGMIVMWFLSGKIGISMTETAVLGFVIIVFMGMVKKSDILDNSVLSSFATIGLFICFVDNLSSCGFFNVFSRIVTPFITLSSNFTSLMLLSFVYICTRLLFNSECAGATAFYALFVHIGISIGIDPRMVIMSLAFFNSIGVAILHYTSTACIPISSVGYVSNKKWALVGIIFCTFAYIVWFCSLYFFMR